MTIGRTRRSAGPPWYALRPPWRALPLQNSARAVVAVRVPAVHRLHGHARAGVRRMDELLVPDVEADVAEAVEEDEVARLEASPADAPPERELRDRVVRQGDAEMRIDEARE